MKPSTYYLAHAGLVLAVAGTLALIHLLAGPLPNAPLCFAAVGFEALVTAGAYAIAQSNLHARPGQFMNAVMGGVTGKLFLSLGFMGVALYFFREGRVAFVAAYFSSYFLFTGFEVYALLSNLRTFSKEASKPSNVTENQ